jgi:5-methylcytosine-specific restriction protein A
MPWASPKPCCEPNCRALVPRGQARCAPHAARKAAEYAQRRAADWTRAVYQTREYRQLRREILAGTPACVDCGTTDRVQLDHVVAIRENPRLALARANLAPRCLKCHVRRTKRGNNP